jgi:hypothetical protein
MGLRGVDNRGAMRTAVNSRSYHGTWELDVFSVWGTYRLGEK